MNISNKMLRIAARLYTQREAALMLKLTFGAMLYRVRHGIYPPPSRTFENSRRKYYIAEDVKSLKLIPFTPWSGGKLICQGEMAARCNIYESYFRRLIRNGRLPGPKHRLKGSARLYYLEAEVPQVLEAFQNLPPLPKGAGWNKAKEAGCYFGVGAAEALGMPLITFYSWTKKGWLPKPTRRLPGWQNKVYNADDIEGMRLILKEKGYKRVSG